MRVIPAVEKDEMAQKTTSLKDEIRKHIIEKLIEGTSLVSVGV